MVALGGPTFECPRQVVGRETQIFERPGISKRVTVRIGSSGMKMNQGTRSNGVGGTNFDLESRRLIVWKARVDLYVYPGVGAGGPARNGSDVNARAGVSESPADDYRGIFAAAVARRRARCGIEQMRAAAAAFPRGPIEQHAVLRPRV